MSISPHLKEQLGQSRSELKCIDGINLVQQEGIIRPGPGLDTRRYAYTAVPVSGNCLANRPAGAVCHGDVVLFRELKDWKRGCGRRELIDYTGGLLAVSVRGQMMLKELNLVDFDREILLLRQYLPGYIWWMRYSVEWCLRKKN
jgi:hypothetical protein